MNVSASFPKMQFFPCPLGYCDSPSDSSDYVYNACNGPRSGVLCGKCSEEYSETLYSHLCREKEKLYFPLVLFMSSIELQVRPGTFQYHRCHYTWLLLWKHCCLVMKDLLIHPLSLCIVFLLIRTGAFSLMVTCNVGSSGSS